MFNGEKIMYAVEFETQVNDGIVRIPQKFEQLYKHQKRLFRKKC